MDYFDLYPKAPEFRADVPMDPELEARGATYRSVHFVSMRRPEGRSGEASFTAHLRPGPDVGLRCRTSGTFDGLGNVQPIDEGFASLIKTDSAPSDTDLARAVLSPEARGALLRANERANSIRVSDHDVTVTHFGIGFAHLLETFGDALSSAVLAMQRELARLPPPTPLRRLGLDVAMQDAAAAHKFTLHAHPLRVGGWFHEDPFSLAIFARSGRTPAGAPHGGGAFLSLRFKEPLGAGLRLRPAHWRDLAANAIGMHDLLVGDRDFDRAWRIDARNEELARALMTPAARALITELAAQDAKIALDDDGLTAQFELPFTPRQLRRALAAVEALRDGLRPERPLGGPYR